MSPYPPSSWSVQFRREREAAWRDLERLVEQVEKQGLRSLSADKVARLPTLFRATLSSLGVARVSVLDDSLLAYLEALTSRAYLVVYAPQRGLFRVAGQFLARGFPAAVRSIAWPLLVAALVILLGAGIAFAMVHADAENFYLFVDHEMASGRDPTASVHALRNTLFSTDDKVPLLTFASFLFTHNSSVGILTFGLGFVFGLPVLLLLLWNGMILGALTALFQDRGLTVEWWSWVLPHGVTELLAIALCGAAGLRVGQVLVFPGEHSRLQALATTGRRMGAVVAGAVVMLLLAGVTEGVFRQIVQDITVRYGLAWLMAVLWIGYFVFAGRRSS